MFHIRHEKHHKNRFLEREKGNKLRKKEVYLRSFENIRTIHEFFNLQSEENKIEIVDNEDFDQTTNTLMQLILNTLQERVKSNISTKK